jgi:cell division protein FtsZ
MVMPGLINLDFADVRAVMAEMGKAMMGNGEADGERRAIDATEAAISNPLLDDVSMKGARGVLINITGGYDMTLFEVDEAANRIREEVDPDANIIFGSTFDESLAGRMRISVVATGIELDGEARKIPRVLLTVREPRQLETVDIQSNAARELSVKPSDDDLVARAGETETAEERAPVMAGHDSEAESVAEDHPDDDSFIPPPPVEPDQSEPLVSGAEPFAAAAMANGTKTAPPLEPPRGPTLFQRVTGAGRARRPQPESTPEPAMAVAAGLQFGSGTPASVAAENLTLPRVEEDLLDIPAFLRRQTN